MADETYQAVYDAVYAAIRDHFNEYVPGTFFKAVEDGVYRAMKERGEDGC